MALSPMLLAVAIAGPASAEWTLVGWNDLGMHCMDSDYAVFSLLPPFNTIHAQLIDQDGRLVRDPGVVTVTYEAVADPDGSINSTSAEKTNFWDHADSLFGVSLSVDDGLAGFRMPGASNRPQAMSFDAASAWFVAEGIPITPTDDAGAANPYPLMRLVARDADGAVLATTDVVLPVSVEMNCAACHASNSSLFARPPSGWVNDPDPERDVRLNILRLHDQREAGNLVFTGALESAGYDPAGLFATAVEGGHAVLCARCHSSNALPGSGLEGISALTRAVHERMAGVFDPVTGLALDSVENRSACYRCHPGAVTRCLRGAMGAAVASDGSRAIQCQSCHGSMRDVASAERVGWLDEPVCQSCHTGTALRNSGEIRYVSAFEEDGTPRAAADDTFATNPDSPAPGLSLYRFSVGHGGLFCEACHGSTHAEFPSTHRNDNLQSVALQGHAGVLADCSTCHAATPDDPGGGPHGLHPIGQSWVDRHGELAEEGGAGACRACHGSDYRGTVLSRAQGDRVLETDDFGTKHFWRGFRIGCYACHRGPSGGGVNPNRPAAARDAEATTARDLAVSIFLEASDADGDPLELRIVSQAANGTVALDGTIARYLPEPGYIGSDAFTFAAWDGSTDSNLARVRISVTERACAGDCGRDGQVNVDELIESVQIALGRAAIEGCPEADATRDGAVGIEDLIGAVDAALHGCP